MSKSHVAQFFSSYSNFTLDRNAAPTKEFLRLKEQYQWKGGSKKYIKARKLFAAAVAEDFNAKFGTMSIISTIGTPCATSSRSIRFPEIFPPLGRCEPW
jgi:hypothetical protein